MRLAVTERAGGRGAAVVLLHGLGCERGQFGRQVDGLAAGLRVLAMDLPGHGDSPEAEAGTDAVVAGVAGELRARDETGCVLVGHSFGGLVALLLATEVPGLARGVVLLDTNLAVGNAARRSNRERAAAPGPWRARFLASMADAWGTGDTPERTAIFQTLNAIPERLARPLWDEILAFEPERPIRRCPVPLLYVRSRRDTDLRRLASLNPLVETLDLRPRHVGHWPQVQCPDVVNAAVERFAARLA